MSVQGGKIRNFFEESLNPTVKQAANDLAVQTALLTKLVERERVVDIAQEFFWMRGTAVCDATGQAQIPLENRVGHDLELVSFSAVAGSASNGGILFFHNSVEPQNLIWSAPQTQYNSDKFHGGMMVPLNGVVVAQFLNVGAAQTVFANVFVRKVEQRINPRKAMSTQVGW